MNKSKGKEKSSVKDKIKNYQKGRREILRLVPKLRKVKKNGR